MTAAVTSSERAPAAPGVHAVTSTAATSLALAALSAVTGMLAARLLGPTARGEFAAIQLWPLLLASLAMLGLPEALTYFAARRTAPAGPLLTTALSLAIPVTIVAAVAGWFAMPHLLHAQSADTIRLARWYMAMCPMFALFGLPHHPLRGLGQFRSWNLIRTLAPLAWMLVLLGGWIFGWHTVRYVVVANLTITVAVGVTVLWIVHREAGLSRHGAPGTAVPMLRYGMPALLTTLPQTLNLRLDQMLMSSVLSSRALGLYVVAVAWSSMSLPAVNALGLVLFPKVAAATEVERAATFARGVRIAVAPTIAVTATAVALTPLGMRLMFGAAYADAQHTALVLLMASAVLSLNFVLGEGLRGLGRPKSALYAELSGLAITGVALLLLLDRFGIMGAAIASLAGYSAVFAMLTRSAVVATGLPPKVFFGVTRADIKATTDALRKVAHR
ncbi:MAG: lipopolysaccharide biosynthesis protein [Acidimicrobiia bacterium]